MKIINIAEQFKPKGLFNPTEPIIIICDQNNINEMEAEFKEEFSNMVSYEFKNENTVAEKLGVKTFFINGMTFLFVPSQNKSLFFELMNK